MNMRAVASLFARVSVVVVVVVATGCPARRDGISRDALERSFASTDGKDPLPTIPAVLQLRVPTPASMPKAITGTPSERAFALGDDLADSEMGTDAAVLRCLRADALRDYPTIVSRCVDVVTSRPEDLRSTIVVALLRRHVPSLSDDARRLILQRFEPLVTSCAAARGAGSCAWLAVAMHDLRVALVEALGDDVVDGGLFVDGADADGPFVDADQHFSGAPREQLALVGDPRRAAKTVRADDTGRLRPSRRGPGGWYRLTSTGTIDADVDAHVFVDRDGPFELRVDGVVVLSRPRDVAAAAIEWIPMRFGAGVHDLELVAWEDGEGVAVAVVDDNGRDVWSTTKAVTPKQAKQEKREKRATSSRNDNAPGLNALLLPPQLDGADAHQLVTTMLRHHAARAGLGPTVDELQTLNAALLARYGWSTPALVLAAQGLEDDALPERFTAALAAPLWARVEAKWPTAPLPLLARARAAAVEQPDLALDLFRQLVRVAPAYPQGRRELLPRLIERDLVDEAVDVADGLVALGAGDDGEAIVTALRAAGRPTAAAGLLDARARRRDGWRRELQAGETDRVRRALLTRVEEREDSDAGDAAFLAALDLVEADDAEAALALVQARLVDADPVDTEVLRLRRARLIALTGGAEAARKALAASPTTTIESLLLAAALGGSLPWADELALGDRVVTERRSSAAPFPTYPFVLLLNHTGYDYADDGTALVIHHLVAEIRNKDAIDAIGEVQKTDNELLLRLRVIKPDGSVLEPEHHSNVDDISLTGLAPGDLVEWLSVRVDRTAQVGDAFAIQSLASRAPVVDWQHTVSWPTTLANARRVTLTSVLGAPKPTTTTIDGRVVNVYTQRDVVPVLPEPMSVDDSDDLPQAVLAIDADTDAIRRSRWLGLVPPSRADRQLREVARIIAGRGDDDTRLRRLFRFVVERLDEADTPAEAIATLATGQGQRLPVLLALTRAAGLKVTPVALHPTLLGDPDRPSSTSFSTPALVIDTGSAQHVAAVISDVALLDRLPSSFKGAHLLSLSSGARSVLPDTAIDPASIEIEIELQLVDIATAPTLKGLAVLRLPAAIAEGVRGSIRGATPEQLAQLMEAGLAASFPGVAASNVTLPGLDSAGGPMAFVADVSVAATDKTVRFEHIFGQGAAAAFRAGVPLAAFVQVADRRRTMRVWPHEERLSVVVHLPSSAGFVEVPPTTTLTAGPFTLQQRTAVADGALSWERTLRYDAARVTRAAWPAVRAGLGPLIAASDARLAFVIGDLALTIDDDDKRK